MTTKDLVELLAKLPPETLIVLHLPSGQENQRDRYLPLEKAVKGQFVYHWVSGDFTSTDTDFDAVVLSPLEM